MRSWAERLGRPSWGALGLGLATFAAALSLSATDPKDAFGRPAKQKPKRSASMSQPAKGRTGSGHKSHAIFDADWASTPAAQYAALDKAACLAEADHRGIQYEEVEEARGVRIPLRLTGPLNGVRYHTELPEKDRATSPFEVFDCRLVLALHDFSAILTSHDIDQALIFSAWRPPEKSWPADKQATRHPGALAVDIRVFEKRNGASAGDKKDLVVARDWEPARDKAPCGDKAPAIAPNTDAGKEIRAIYCAAASARLFNSMLGPNFNKAHENHFHLEVTPGVEWRLTL